MVVGHIRWPTFLSLVASQSVWKRTSPGSTRRIRSLAVGGIGLSARSMWRRMQDPLAVCLPRLSPSARAGHFQMALLGADRSVAHIVFSSMTAHPPDHL